MPLFFNSGFLAYSSKAVWSARTLGQPMLKKLRVQMLPTVVFFCFVISNIIRISPLLKYYLYGRK